jgi:DNA/RNA endonuclease YhcR with UshA esterase domain
LKEFRPARFRFRLILNPPGRGSVPAPEPAAHANRKPMRRTLFIACAALAVLIASSAFAPAAPPFTYTIARARSLPAGREVTVEGVVTVPSGVIDAGFAIQDATGGIYVADSTQHVAAGARMRVTGRIASNHGLLTIEPTSLRRIGHGRVPRGRRVRTSAVGERTEGRLVTVRGTAADSVQNDMPYGHTLRIDDGSGAVQVFFPAASSFDFHGIRRGTRITVTGFSGQYDQTNEVLPRSRSDVVIVGG